MVPEFSQKIDSLAKNNSISKNPRKSFHLTQFAACFVFPLFLVMGIFEITWFSSLNAAEPISLFNGKNLDQWRFRNPKATSKWTITESVMLDPKMPNHLVGKKGESILLNGDNGHGVDLLSLKEHGDCELTLEFMVAKGSNSGIYFQGQYEVQILDSFGKKDKELQYGDCGGIYNTAPPKMNATKAPGEWQKFKIIFQAPRFDKSGKKIESAKFIAVYLNDRLIQENVSVKGPTTSALGGKEKPKGPLMLQGDHGPVAFRNIQLKEKE